MQHLLLNVVNELTPLKESRISTSLEKPLLEFAPLKTVIVTVETTVKFVAFTGLLWYRGDVRNDEIFCNGRTTIKNEI